MSQQHPTRTAWVFPGQGSQAVGMGRDLFEASPAARDVLQLADATLGFALTRLCFEGPEDELTQTANAQPAIMAVSLACLAAARQAGLPAPAFGAGHSLGEYTALVAAGSLSIEDGLRLVRERGRLMQAAGEAAPGTLAAVLGLDEGALADVCERTGAELCNLNAPGQIVIGGTKEAVAAAIAGALEAGARRAVGLNVSGAFHTSLMRPAVEGMAGALAGVELRDPEWPVVANGSAAAVTTAAAIRDELLYQLDHPVLWQRSVEFMAREGVRTFVELGPGRVLTGLIRRITPVARLVNVDGVEAVAALREA